MPRNYDSRAKHFTGSYFFFDVVNGARGCLGTGEEWGIRRRRGSLYTIPVDVDVGVEWRMGGGGGWRCREEMICGKR